MAAGGGMRLDRLWQSCVVDDFKEATDAGPQAEGLVAGM